MQKLKTKILSSLVLILIIFSIFQPFVRAAAQISSADIKPGENLRTTLTI